jgi:hypothetical protein
MGEQNMQKLLLTAQREKMLANGRANLELRTRPDSDGETVDYLPVVKLFTPWTACTWLLTELDPENPDIAFGLCDLGQGFPELGSVSLVEIRELRHRSGLYVERDAHFTATKTLGAYAAEARAKGRIEA